MPILASENLQHSFGDRIILDGISFSIEDGERIGLVGRNGEGKSTLLRALAGAFVPDSGRVNVQRGKRVGVLDQHPKLTPGRTMHEEVISAFARIYELEHELASVFELMADCTAEEVDKLLRRQEELEHELEAAGGYAVEHKVGAVLHGLGFSDEQFAVPVEGLSGGQRARVALAKLLLAQPDCLLMDEPTNHLDIEGRVWLENFLRDEFRGSVLLISHDRRLLDGVVTRIIELERARLIDYPGNYKIFRQLRAERREAQFRAWENEQTRFKKEEAFIRKFKAGQRAKQAKGRESRLDRAKTESVQEKPMELQAFRFTLPKAERPGELVVVARGLSKKYTQQDGTEQVLFTDLDVTIGRGERWAILGPNGAGKTTLIKTLLGTVQPDQGTVTIGSRVSVGYFEQNPPTPDPTMTVVRAIQKAIEIANPTRLLSEQEARDLAGAFLFSGQDQDKQLHVLSGGERARVSLASLLASAKNLLVLDEPTNHLDIPSSERLEEAMSPERGYDGAMLLISHDRALIDALCEHLIIFDGKGGVTVYHGTYSDWVESVQRRNDLAATGQQPATSWSQITSTNSTKSTHSKASQQTSNKGASKPTQQASNTAASKQPASTAQATRSTTTSQASKPAGQPVAPKRKSKFSWMSMDQVEERMGELQAELVTIDEDLANAATWNNPARAEKASSRRDDIATELEQLEEEWLYRSAH